MAISWLGGSKVDHPMADAKQARRIIDELPANDAAKALPEITEWLDSLTRTEGFKLDLRFENVGLLDAAAKTAARRLSQEYLSTPRQQKFHENRLWNAVFGFWQQLADAYILCLDQHDSGASGASAIRKSLPVIVARALRALTLQLKWRLLRYGPVESRVWAELARLYLNSEQKGFTDSAIAVYPGAHGASTVKREFLKAMMFTASSPEGLPPLRQEIAERAVAHFADAFRLSTRPEGCTHCFDLAVPKAPVRLFKGVAPTATLRFFGAGEGFAGLNQLTELILERGGIPKDVNLGGDYEKELVVGVLKHLAQQWPDQPSTRSSERRLTAGRITVVPGLKDILQTLDPSDDDTLDFSQVPSAKSAESWIVENASDGGYGAIIPGMKSDWIKVGMLIGVRSETAEYWGVGLIRRIVVAEQQRRVGIQLLTTTAIPVKISMSRTMSFTDADRETEPVILLSTGPDSRGEIGVVMRGGLYNGRDSLDMTVREKSFSLMPVSLVEGGDDFDWAKFKVVKQAS
jgi:hypothetical protein